MPLEYTVEQAQEEVKRTTAVLGADYVQALDRAFRERWIDYYPTTGKQSGAYMAGYAYDVHPYMLLNYNGKDEDMSALTHEAGHLMHSYFSSKTQPYPTAGYPTFVAEVASTFNEALLIEQMLKKVQDPKARLALLGNYLEGVRARCSARRSLPNSSCACTRWRRKASRSPATRCRSSTWRSPAGTTATIRRLPSSTTTSRHEWAYISHFYNPFYVFQYATSFTASTALSEKVLSGAPDAIKRTGRFLPRAGRSIRSTC